MIRITSITNKERQYIKVTLLNYKKCIDFIVKKETWVSHNLDSSQSSFPNTTTLMQGHACDQQFSCLWGIHACSIEGSPFMPFDMFPPPPQSKCSKIGLLLYKQSSLQLLPQWKEYIFHKHMLTPSPNKCQQGF